jgi:hypothetical protein
VQASAPLRSAPSWVQQKGKDTMASERWREHKYKLSKPKSGHKHWVLQYARKRKSGKYGKYENWTLEKGVPPWIFKWLLKRVKDLFKDLHSKEKTYHKALPKIIKALIANGKAQGFKAKRTTKHYGDVTWYIDGIPFATFLIADMSEYMHIWGSSDAPEKLRADKKSGEGHRFREMERKSRAPVRIVWSVSINGKWFRLGIGKMRER